MSLWTQHLTEVLSLRGELGEVTAGLTIRSYSGPENERDALNAAVGVVDRSYRGLLEITGGDRAAWLHNLTTNQVKTLSAGDGHYAFVLNLQGRILFDVNVLVDAESIWLDLDRQWLDRARSHFDKYTITEDVTVTDRSEESVRFGIAGPRVADLLAQFDAPHAPNWPSLGLKQFAWSGETIRAFRHDFCGAFAVECVVPAALAVAFWEDVTAETRSPRATPVGWDAVQESRIEAGIPWPGREITDEYLPAETGQSERAVSFHKGCYLGQEVVERMRSRNVVARRLVGLQCPAADTPNVPADLCDADGATVGKMTSACHPAGRGGSIGLGYVKTASSVAGTSLAVRYAETSSPCQVVELPFAS